MAEPLRRSWLLLPGNRADLIEQAAGCGADVVVLDLEDLVHDSRKAEARAAIKEAIAKLRVGGAEVFVRCDIELLYADLDAAVWPGLTGVVLPKVTAAAQVLEAEALLAHFEAERGVRRAGPVNDVNEADEPRSGENALEIHLALENAGGNHNALALLQASPRVYSVSLGRADLVMDLRPEPKGDLHLLPYLMQRLIVAANAAGVVPIGAWWQANSRGLRASAEDTFSAARLGRAAGFKGAICRDAEQVAALNRGFTPSGEELQQARMLADAFERTDAHGGTGVADGDLLVGAALAGAARSVEAAAVASAARDRATAEARTRAEEQRL